MRICWILGADLGFHLPTTVSCLNYTRRKTKSKNPTSVKKWIFSKKEVLQNHPHFGETVWTDFHTAKKRIIAFENSVFSFAFYAMKKSHKQKLWKQADISMFPLMKKSHLFQCISHEKIPVAYIWHYEKDRELKKMVLNPQVSYILSLQKCGEEAVLSSLRLCSQRY